MKTGRPFSDLINRADNLMAGYKGEHGQRKIALNNVQIGPTETAGIDSQADLARTRNRLWQFDRYERIVFDRARTADIERPHVCLFTHALFHKGEKGDRSQSFTEEMYDTRPQDLLKIGAVGMGKRQRKRLLKSAVQH
jgi:hypothetical protein